ncbi:DUF4158 domain-containing protein [Streptomyces sp. C184]|uniref:DUF4158 domain-containing protein n=1 Tax=Streptomyces sp. C184 TaxID=3237121 RepID=UPI0034C5DEE2
MPVEFLTDAQAASYGKFNEEPTRPELERFFFLDDEDRKLIAKRRGDHNPYPCRFIRRPSGAAYQVHAKNNPSTTHLRG